jgi:predicted transposase YdaD
MAGKPRKKSDIILKAVFKDYFTDMLWFLYPDADHIFDKSKAFDFLDKELLELYPDRNNKGGTRHVDLLVKVFLIDGIENWLLFHCEIQNLTNNDFPQRVYQYNYRLYDRYKIPIVSLAIFTGEKNQLQPNEYKSNILGTEISFKYKTYQIFDHTEEQLLDMDNPFAMVVLALQQEVLTCKALEETQNNARIKILRALIKNEQFNNEDKKRFLAFLDNLIYIENPDLNRKFNIEVERLTGGKINMGIIEAVKEDAREEGIEEGLIKGKEEIALRMKQAGYSLEEIAQLTELSEKEIQALDAEANAG